MPTTGSSARITHRHQPVRLAICQVTHEMAAKLHMIPENEFPGRIAHPSAS